MNRQQKIREVIEKYLYTRDDILDLNDVPNISVQLSYELDKMIIC